jgi:hypothetical protein
MISPRDCDDCRSCAPCEEHGLRTLVIAKPSRRQQALAALRTQRDTMLLPEEVREYKVACARFVEQLLDEEDAYPTVQVE